MNLKFPVQKSELQRRLERQGCRFSSQELLTNHEPDINKPCACGRPDKLITHK